MSIKEQLTADMKEAMKSHDKDRLSVIRFVRGAIRQAEIDGGHKELSDEDVIGVISKEVKMRKDSIEEFEEGRPRGPRRQDAGRDRCAHAVSAGTALGR